MQLLYILVPPCISVLLHSYFKYKTIKNKCFFLYPIYLTFCYLTSKAFLYGYSIIFGIGYEENSFVFFVISTLISIILPVISRTISIDIEIGKNHENN